MTVDPSRGTIEGAFRDLLPSQGMSAGEEDDDIGWVSFLIMTPPNRREA
jgi:hypothetical protein